MPPIPFESIHRCDAIRSSPAPRRRPGEPPPAPLVAPPRPARGRRGHLRRRAPRRRAPPHALLLRLRAPRILLLRPPPRPCRANPRPARRGDGRAVLGWERARVPSAERVWEWISELAHPFGGWRLVPEFEVMCFTSEIDVGFIPVHGTPD